MSMKTVIIDNGHGRDTAGKRSPDGRLLEWKWTRCVARRLCGKLRAAGLEPVLLVPGDADVTLRERCRRANELCSGREAVLLSLHTNASGTGKEWGTASGWSAFVSPNASENSRRLAALLHEEAVSRGLAGNRMTPSSGYYTANLAICRDTLCPAVLTENLFHDNLADVDYLLTDRGQENIAELHVWAVMKYFGES